MRYVEHMQDDSSNSTKRRWWSVDFSPLRQVTKLSKTLAVSLFIILPFGGFWLGLQHVPESQPMMIVATSSPQSADNESDASAAATTTTQVRDFHDSETGISFSYPAAWGEITSQDEIGECPPEYTEDSCRMRQYSVTDREQDMSGVFLVAATVGHGLHPIARGAFWGDRVHQQSPTYRQDCVDTAYCELYANQEGYIFALYEHTREGFGALDQDNSDSAFYYHSPEREFQFIAASPAELGWLSVDLEAFRTEFVRTLTFLTE